MYYREYSPSQQLAPYIKSFIIIEDTEGDICNKPMHIYPSGHPEMIFSYGDTVVLSPDRYILRSGEGYLSGQTLSPVFYRCTGKLRIISILFKPFGTYRFLGIPQREFTGARIPVDLLLNQQGKDHIDRLCNEPDRTQKLELLSAFFCSLLQTTRIKNLHIARASFFLQQMPRSSSIAAFCNMADISIKTLERDFRKVVGILPGELARVLRFNSAFNALQEGTDISLHDIIFNAGYYDQSHFINDFKRYTSLTPSHFINKQNEGIKHSFREIIRI